MYIQTVIVLYVLYMYITIQKHIFKEKVECCEELYWSMPVGKYPVFKWTMVHYGCYQ